MIVPELPVETAAVAKHYDELDEFYRDVWGEHVHHGYWQSGDETPETAVTELVHMVARRANIVAGCRVCDVGCGYGGTSRLLAAEYGANVTGLTVSNAQFQFASQQASPLNPPQFLLCPWEHNPFEDASFDRIVSIECISHVPDKPEFYRQICRVLRPGGKAVVIAWLAHPDASKVAIRHLLLPICVEGRLPGLATAEEYRGMIADAGLVLNSYSDISQQVRRTWWICAKRLIRKVVSETRYRRALLNRSTSNRVFALTVFRIMAAYRTGAMQYGVFEMSKPDNGRPDVNSSEPTSPHS